MVWQIGRSMNLIIRGRLGYLPCSFILDTGATKSIIRPDIVQHKQLRHKNSYLLKTATGENVPISGIMTDCVRLGDRIYEHDFLVADVTDECNLDLDFTDKFGFIINVAARTLKQGNMEFPL